MMASVSSNCLKLKINATFSVPTWNSLTIWTSTQTLANFLTLQENIEKPLNEISFAYVGHGQSNMCNALMSGAVKLGMDFRLIGPKQYHPEGTFFEECKNVLKRSLITIR